MNNSAKRTRKLVFVSVLVAQAMILSYIERLIPFPFIAPGAKLGLANIITITAIYMLTFKEAFAVVILRIILTAVTFGSMSSFLYSLSGGMLSLFAMAAVLQVFRKDLSLVSISIIGAIAHNVGQLLVAGVVINSLFMISYLPILLIVAVPTGIFVGFVAKYLINYLESIQFNA